jgi:ADP-heptose:LPS heptosyltransferase
MTPLLYRVLAHLPACQSPPADPRRVVLIRPCCIGDVVQATAAAAALHRHYPQAQITWAVGTWSRQVVEAWQPTVSILDTGKDANPAGSWRGFWRLVRQLRAGHYDLAVSLVRSPLVSAAVALSGIPYRVGIDSAGRGFGYNLRVPIDPAARRHEAAVYLDVVRALGAETDGIYPHIPLTETDTAAACDLLTAHGVSDAYLVVNPSGGKNPGAVMDVKRYPPDKLARLVRLLQPTLGFTHVVIVAGPGDHALAAAVSAHLGGIPHTAFVGSLTFRQIGAIGRRARLYLGNDTGLTHYAAAAGAPTAMLLGPTDPARYAPYTPRSVALWREYVPLPGGFAAGVPPGWNWDAHGITPEDAAAQIIAAGL